MSHSLTFGLELEFLTVYKESAFTRGLPDVRPHQRETEVGPVHAIAHCLETHNIVASEFQTYDKWYIHEDALRLSPQEMRVLPQGYFQEAIEISSRKFNFADDWEQEVEKVLSVLHWMRGEFGCEFLTNSSTGLHVHIGDSGGHSLTTVKRMMQIATVHERNFDLVHYADRIVDIVAAPEMDMDNDYPRPLFAGLSFFHALAEYSQNKTSILDFMESIEVRDSLAELGDICRVRYQGRVLDGHTCTLNLDNLYPDPKASRYALPPTGTMEFRQHGGRLDYEGIIYYISLLADLTHFCATATDAKIVTLVAQGVNTTFDLKALLNSINCHDELINHFCNRQTQDPVTASDPLLQPLIEIKNVDSATRRSVAATQAAIARKIQTNVYGIIFDDGFTDMISVSTSEYIWMLSCAEKDIIAPGSPQPIDLKSRARQEIFRKIADIYAGLDRSVDPHQDIVQRELVGWMEKYGEPHVGSEEEEANEDEEMEDGEVI